jgi:hypothetical protein
MMTRQDQVAKVMTWQSWSIKKAFGGLQGLEIMCEFFIFVFMSNLTMFYWLHIVQT